MPNMSYIIAFFYVKQLMCILLSTLVKKKKKKKSSGLNWFAQLEKIKNRFRTVLLKVKNEKRKNKNKLLHIEITSLKLKPTS